MKKYFLSILGLCFCVALLSAVQQAGATQFVNENWDSGTPPSGWPCLNSSGSTFNGWLSNPPGIIPSAGLSSANVTSGSRSFFQFRPAGSASACDISHTISSSPTKLFIRFNLLMTSDWAHYDNPAGSDEYVHFVFTNSAQSGTGFRVNLLNSTFFAPQSGPYMWFLCENNSSMCGGPSSYSASNYNLLSHLNQWQCVEFGMDTVAKTFQIWINGKLETTYTNNPFPDSTFNKVILSGWTNDGTHFENYQAGYYVDDLAISDTGPIGCGPSTTAPKPPVIQ